MVSWFSYRIINENHFFIIIRFRIFHWWLQHDSKNQTIMEECFFHSTLRLYSYTLFYFQIIFVIHSIFDISGISKIFVTILNCTIHIILIFLHLKLYFQWFNENFFFHESFFRAKISIQSEHSGRVLLKKLKLMKTYSISHKYYESTVLLSSFYINSATRWKCTINAMVH